jgi:Zn-finger nucleic acid-binding protein
MKRNTNEERRIAGTYVQVCVQVCPKLGHVEMVSSQPKHVESAYCPQLHDNHGTAGRVSMWVGWGVSRNRYNQTWTFRESSTTIKIGTLN